MTDFILHWRKIRLRSTISNQSWWQSFDLHRVPQRNISSSKYQAKYLSREGNLGLNRIFNIHPVVKSGKSHTRDKCDNVKSECGTSSLKFILEGWKKVNGEREEGRDGRERDREATEEEEETGVRACGCVRVYVEILDDRINFSRQLTSNGMRARNGNFSTG